MSRTVRIAGQAPEDWSESTRAEFAGVDEAARHRLHLPSVIATHPTFLPPYMTWAKAVALSGVLERRDNALLALRTGFRCDSEFEWGVHAETAVHAGRARRRRSGPGRGGPRRPGLVATRRGAARAADELQDVHTISDATWEELGEFFTPDARLEVAFVCGHYTMLSMVANTVGVRPEEQWQPLPTSTMGEQ